MQVTSSVVVVAIVLLAILALCYWIERYHSPLQNEKPGPEATENFSKNELQYLEGIYLHELHMADQRESVALVVEIKKRVEKLMAHLGKKYAVVTLKNGYGHERRNRIDVIGNNSMYSDYDTAATIAAGHNLDREELVERIRQLFANYDGNIYEISPTNKENLTSYTENKIKLILCLRHKTPDSSGHYPLHDINTMMFVVVHELTHILNDEFDHGPKFWHLFEFMLHNAIEADIYNPVDYSKHRINYCGLVLSHNPLYD